MEKALTIDPTISRRAKGCFNSISAPRGRSAAARRQGTTRGDPETRSGSRDHPGVVKPRPERRFRGRIQDVRGRAARNGRTTTRRCIIMAARRRSAARISNAGWRACAKCLSSSRQHPPRRRTATCGSESGNILEQLHRPVEARAAYETALKLDPGNRQASDALAKLK